MLRHEVSEDIRDMMKAQATMAKVLDVAIGLIPPPNADGTPHDEEPT